MDDQPVHILAGWCVPDGANEGYRKLIADLKAGRPQASELKGKDLLKSDSGQRLIQSFLEGAIALGCKPLWSASEKNFCAAAKVVETFFDPAHNKRAGWLPTGANADRQKIAGIFAHLARPMMKEFVSAYNTPSVESLRASARSLRNAMNLLGHPLLALTLDGAIEQMEEIADAEQTTFWGGKHKVGISLNFPVFVQYMMLADEYLGHLGATSVEVIHDETTEFEAAFRQAFEIFGKAKRSEAIQLQNGTMVYFGLDRLRNFRTANGKTEEHGLQGADLLASALRSIFLNVAQDRPIPNFANRYAKSILGTSPEVPKGNFWMMGSQPFWRRFSEIYQRSVAMAA